MKLEAIKQFPHCDSRVLHSPGECKYCDEHKDWQELRQVWGVNFTGKHDPGKLTCPAERERTLDNINAWGGNRPQDAAEEARQEAHWAAVRKALVDSGISVPTELPGDEIEGSSNQYMTAEAIAAKHPDNSKITHAGEVKVTNSGKPPCPEYDGPAPCPIEPETGMHQDYWVLAPEERAKGFVRPLRNSYVHIGRPGPKNPLRDLTSEQQGQYSKYNYVKFEAYPNSESAVTGRFWTQEQLDSVGKGCGAVTRMGDAIAETYARNPTFYGATFCVRCGSHFAVGDYEGEFVWDGTNIRVGT